MASLRQLKIETPAGLKSAAEAGARLRSLDVAVRANTAGFESAMSRLAATDSSLLGLLDRIRMTGLGSWPAKVAKMGFPSKPRPLEFSVEPIRAFFREILEDAGTRVGERIAAALRPRDTAPQRKPGAADLLTNEEKAIALAATHPEWTDTRIAEHLGVNRTSVYRWERFKDARKKLRKLARNEASDAQRRKTMPPE